MKKQKKKLGAGSKKERGGGGGGQLNLCAGTRPFDRDKSDGCARNASLPYHAYPVSRTTGEERAEWSKGREGEIATALGR